MRYPVIYVVWKDHAEANTEAWANVNELSGNKLVEATTIGFLVHEDDEAIQVSTTYIEKYDLCGRPDIIAKSLIVYRTELDVKSYVPPKTRSRRAQTPKGN